MGREFDQTWTFTSSGAGTAVQVTGDVLDSVWYITSGPASTVTVHVRSAAESTGPWFVEASTTVSTVATCRALRVTGPFAWVSPRNEDTGACVVRCIGV